MDCRASSYLTEYNDIRNSVAAQAVASMNATGDFTLCLGIDLYSTHGVVQDRLNFNSI